jgi:hypothetical protein
MAQPSSPDEVVGRRRQAARFGAGHSLHARAVSLIGGPRGLEQRPIEALQYRVATRQCYL